jgi:hypothetical protein
MICHDCTQRDRRDSAAVGVCTRCGLASCLDHGRVLGSEVRHANGMGRTTGPLKARRFLCTVCSTAESAF